MKKVEKRKGNLKKDEEFLKGIEKEIKRARRNSQNEIEILIKDKEEVPHLKMPLWAWFLIIPGLIAFAYLAYRQNLSITAILELWK